MWRLLAAAAMLFVISMAATCDKAKNGSNRRTCPDEGDASSCQVGESCLWVHLGNESGYFCAFECDPGGTTCRSGQTCGTGNASSCMTCQNLLNVCE